MVVRRSRGEVLEERSKEFFWLRVEEVWGHRWVWMQMDALLKGWDMAFVARVLPLQEKKLRTVSKSLC